MKNHHLITAVLLLTFFFPACEVDNGDSNGYGDRNFKQDMRDFVQRISEYAKNINSSFAIIPQNGHEILTKNGETDGPAATTYMNHIDGVGREDLFYGYEEDNEPTPQSDRNYMIKFMDIAENNGVEVLVTDYCWDLDKMDDSYAQNVAKKYTSFAADHRELDNIPAYPEQPHSVNDSDITYLSEIKNFLYLLNTDQFESKQAFLSALQNTDYDLVLIDLFYDGTEELTAPEVASLKTKKNGGRRLIVCYMSIGEAEDYRYYWRSQWNANRPEWLKGENPDWEGNFKVQYWNGDWQKIIVGNDDSYLKRILDAGFDGVYLDIIDAFESFGNQ